MKSINKFDLGEKAKGCAAVAISSCGRYVATVDMSNDHNVSVYNVKKTKPIFSISAGNDAISLIRWSKKQNDLRFCALTSRALQFWSPADSSKKLFKNGAFGPNNTQTKFNCANFDDDGVCYSGGENGAVHIWDQKGDLALVLKAHPSMCSAVVANQGILVSTGKDYRLCIHSYSKGTYEFVKQIDLTTKGLASALDYLDGKILVGHDCGVVCTVDIKSEKESIYLDTHCEGEVWGLEINQDRGTFYTSGDDNCFMEVDMFKRQCVRKGKIWDDSYNKGKKYETTKIKSTASTLSSLPAHQQARAITICDIHDHVAVANCYGDILIF